MSSLLGMHNALVVGAGSEVGADIVASLDGYKVYMQGRSLNKTAGDGTVVLPFDVCSKDGMKMFKESIADVKFDLFVFAMGMLGEMDPVPFADVENDIRTVFEVNLFSAVEITEFLIPRMKLDGSIVYITSTNSVIPLECGLGYCCTKCALTQFAKSMALEHPEIRINTVAPGLLDTKFHHKYFDTMDEYREFIENSKAEHPLGRLPSLTGVTNAVKFLASEEASEITGTEIFVDCGNLLVEQSSNEEESV